VCLPEGGALVERGGRTSGGLTAIAAPPTIPYPQRPTSAGQTSRAISLHMRIRFLNNRASSLVARPLVPCFRAFRAETAFPAAVVGPVDRSHGFHWPMRAA
jgi:hypothetical protein